MKPAEIRAVVFDMDGVLVDAREWHYQALNRALGLFGFAISRYDHLTSYDGLPTREKLKRLTVEQGLPQELHRLVASAKQLYTRQIIALECKPQFDKEFMFSRLASRGYSIAVASNAVRESVELMLDRSRLLEYLVFFLSNEDVKRPKPDPEIYRVAIERLGMAPEEVLVVEDNQYGVMAAEQSGAHLIRVAGVEQVNLGLIDEFLARHRR